MTVEERVDAIVRRGFTERQARFLITVMRHGGICLPRQYTAFAGIVYGQKTRKFFGRLVEEGHATRCRCFHNRATIYRLQRRILFGADQGGTQRAVSAGSGRRRRASHHAAGRRPRTTRDGLAGRWHWKRAIS